MPDFTKRCAGLTIVTAIMLCLPAQAKEARSIVGSWQYENLPCTPATGLIVIRPQGLAIGEDIACDFQSVRRRGSTVIFKGECSAEGNTNAETVTARESKDGLVLTFASNKTTHGPVKRCQQ
jgi:hypothetical protein